MSPREANLIRARVPELGSPEAAVADYLQELQDRREALVNEILRTAVRSTFTGERVSRERARVLVAPLAEKFGGVVRIIESVDEVPAEDRTPDLPDRFRGYFALRSQTVYIMAGEHASDADVLRSVAHELKGHFGLRRFLAGKYDTVMDAIYQSARTRPAFQAVVAAYRYDTTKLSHRRAAAEEYVSHLAETSEDPTLLQRVVSAVREFLRDLGFVTEFSDNDIRVLLSRTHTTPIRDVIVKAQAPLQRAGVTVRLLRAHDVPAEVTEKFLREHPQGSRLQGYWRGDEVVLIEEHLRDAREAMAALAHETIGHLGVENLVSDWPKLLAQFRELKATSRDPRFLRVLAEVRRRYGQEDPTQEAKEFLAIASEHRSRETAAGFAIRRMREAIVDGLRTLGVIDDTFSMTDVDKLLDRAAERVFAQGEGTDPVFAAAYDGPEVPRTPVAPDIQTIEVDGKIRPARNELGALIHNTEEGLRNFWRWFGDSSTVDKKGRPRVFYHATDAAKDFTVFKRTGDIGYHFGTRAQAHARMWNAEPAEWDSRRVTHAIGKDLLPSLPAIRILPVYLRTRDSLRLLDDDWSYQRVYRDLARRGSVVARGMVAEFRSLLADWVRSDGDSPAILTRDGLENTEDARIPALVSMYIERRRNTSASRLAAQKAFLRALRRDGYEGVTYRNRYEAPKEEADSHIVFDPTQVKSALGNTGAYNPRSGQIHLMVRAPEVSPDERIEVDGVERPTVNSEGALIHPTRRGVENFWRWFGGSVVKDDQGRPLVVYHGNIQSEEDLRILGRSFEAGSGTFLTDSEDVAQIFRYERDYGAVVTEAYSEDTGEYEDVEPGALLHLYARLENPLILDENSDVDPQKFTDDTGTQTRVLRQAAADGHDGIIVRGVSEGVGDWTERGTTYVIFGSEQAKSATSNNGDFSEDPDILLRKADKKPQKPETAPRISLVVAPEAPQPGVVLNQREAQITLAGREEERLGPKKMPLRALAVALDQRARRAFPGRNLLEHTVANRRTLGRILTHEVLHHLRRGARGVHWYQDTLTSALDRVRQHYPETRDPAVMRAYTFALAISSGGLTVATNTAQSFKIFDHFLRTGEFLEEGTGEQAEKQRENFERANRYIRDDFNGDVEAFFDQLDIVATVRQHSAAGYPVSGEGVSQVLPRSATFGPKVGIFYQNLSGNFQYVTMDRWWVRTWNRVTGTLMEGVERRVAEALQKYLAVADAETPGHDLRSLPQDALLEHVVSAQRAVDRIYRQYPVTPTKKNPTLTPEEAAENEARREATKTPLVRAGKRVIAANGPVTSPRGAQERAWMRRVVTDVVDAIHGANVEGKEYINPGSVQAALWGPEKDFYAINGAANSAAEETDYDAEIARFFRDRPRRVRARVSRGSRDGRWVDRFLTQRGVPGGTGEGVVGTDPVELTGSELGPAGDPESLPAKLRLSESVRQVFNAVVETEVDRATIRQRINELTTEAKTRLLKVIPLGYLRDFAARIPAVADYVREVERMNATVQREIRQIAPLVFRFERHWRGLDKPGREALAKLMNEATVFSVDPTAPYHDLPARDNVERKAKYAELKALFDSDVIGAPGRELFAEVRDAHERNFTAKTQALLNRLDQIKDQIAAEAAAAAAQGRSPSAAGSTALTALRIAMESQRLPAPYFHLHRSGRFFISGYDPQTKERIFSRRDTQEEADELAAELREDGYLATVGNVARTQDTQRAFDDVFVAKVTAAADAIKDPAVRDAFKDQVYQAVLETLPEAAMRRRALHRKNRAGYSADVMSGFARLMFHDAQQLGKLAHVTELEAALRRARKEAQDAHNLHGDPMSLFTSAELESRHEWVMDPVSAPLAVSLNRLGFLWYLGFTPAAMAVNLVQLPMVALPVMGARFGWAGATRELAVASRELSGAARSNWRKRAKERALFLDDDAKTGYEDVLRQQEQDLDEEIRTAPNLTTRRDAEQRRAAKRLEIDAYEALHMAGAFEKTQSHDLAGLSNLGERYSGRAHRFTEYAAAGFHNVEGYNRETTGMAAYRLAFAKKQKHADGTAFSVGEQHEWAIEQAREMVNFSHFIYEQTHRAPFMQGNFGRVVFLFKQHSLNMTYRLVRDALWAFRDAKASGVSPEQIREAKARFGGILGMAAVFAGLSGFPMYWVAELVANSLLGDDDEPFDLTTALRHGLSEAFGEWTATAIMKGAVDATAGIGVSNRVGLNNLWLRDPSVEMEGEDLWNYYFMELFGPVPKIGANIVRAVAMTEEGYDRGYENALPKAVRDAAKALRYLNEGVLNLRGDPLIEKLPLRDVVYQALGFVPETVGSRYEENRAVKGAEQHILRRRAELLNRYYMAKRAGDKGELEEVEDMIAEFNEKNQYKITPDTVARSMKQRKRYSEESMQGISVNKNLRYLKEERRFLDA
jgi:hypothetical protein